MQAITASHLRANIKKYLDLVNQDHETIIIPRNGEEDSGVVMMSLKEYNAIRETEFLLSNPVNRKRLLQSLEEAEQGKVHTMTLDELDRMIAERTTDEG